MNKKSRVACKYITPRLRDLEQKIAFKISKFKKKTAKEKKKKDKKKI